MIFFTREKKESVAVKLNFYKASGRESKYLIPGISIVDSQVEVEKVLKGGKL